MKLRRSFWRGIKPLVNFPKWMGYSYIKKTTGNISSLAKAVFTVDKKGRTETFDSAQKRLRMNEADIKRREKEFYVLSIVFLVVAIVLTGYTIYLAISRHFFGTVFGCIVSLIAYSEAFRYHFWLFQTKQRRLGCSVREWFEYLLKGKR